MKGTYKVGVLTMIADNKLLKIGIKSSIILLIAFGIIWTIRFVYKKNKEKTHKEEIYKKFTSQLLQSVVFTLAVYLVLKQMPIENGVLNAVSTSASLLVVILGFAAQEALGNVINGVFISASKPFDIGDRVRLVSLNITGIVEDITLRHTIVRTFENKRLVVPNSVMNKEIIENSNFKDESICNFLDIEIAYESDIDLAIKIIKGLVREHKYFYDTRSEEDKANGADDVSVLVRELSDEGICLRCTVWTKDTSKNFQMCSDLRKEIVREFCKNNIEIPYKHIKIVE